MTATEPMTVEEATKLIRQFAYNQVQTTHQANRGKGEQQKGTAKEERKLIAKLLRRLTGVEPTDEQIDATIFT